ncbi:hypothetical protein ACFYU9_11035 [Streptomyces sp. NPDC004327]|uniref:hypothetical protein n=1 Tax=Streptomyces sp. NPDC004327 TaxID=3364699 RepID=UPI00367AB11F
MRIAPLRRGTGAAAAVALACATTLTGVGTAQAVTHQGQDRHEAVDVRLTEHGIEAPDAAEGGIVHFRISTDNPGGRQLQVFRPHQGVSVDKVLADLAKAVNENPAIAKVGITAFNKDAEALGGGFATPKVPVDVTEPISDGTVYLLDFSAFLADPAHPVLRSLELCDGDPDKGLAPFPKGIVLQEKGPRFRVEDVNRADAPILVHNTTDEIHEMLIRPVKPGTTDADIQAYFDALAHGQQPPSPFTGPPSGLGAISADHTAIVQAKNLPAGRYVLLCFIPDDENGIPHAFLGMHKVVQLS